MFSISPGRFRMLKKLQQEMKRLEHETIALSLEKITGGRQFRELVETSQGFQFNQLLELSPAGDKAFSELQDYLKEYGDCYDLYSATDKLNVNQDVQGIIDRLLEVGYTLGTNIRQVRWGANLDGAKPCIVTILTVIIGSASAFPQMIRIPKSGKTKF